MSFRGLPPPTTRISRTPRRIAPTEPLGFGPGSLKRLGRLTQIYWSSKDARYGALLFVLAIALELGVVFGNVLLADAERRILDALEVKSARAFSQAIALFGGVTVVFVVAAAYRIYTRQALEIRWRYRLTAHYVDRWMRAQAYCQSELHRGEMDNPDQRIAEDVREYVASALGLSLSFIAACATLLSFGGLLWLLSNNWSFDLGRGEVRVPGLMLWVALGYALFAMWITHRVGRRLTPINFERLRCEADFRYGLVRFRDSVEAVALSRGEERERNSALDRMGDVVHNWWQLIRAQRQLTLLTSGIGQMNALVPVLVATPAYFAGHLTLGHIIQTRIAYGQVSGALTWFVNAYQEIARWRANIERLSGLAEIIDTTTEEIARAEIHAVPARDEKLRLVDLRLTAPGGRVLLDRVSLEVGPGERIALVGPSGSGKTALFRSIAGLWPFGSGRIELPSDDRMLFLPQRPYLPIGTLRAAVAYPSPVEAFADERIRDALRELELADLIPELDVSEHWEQHLSGHEQQRLSLARVLLQEPRWIFLDDATGALDEEMEERVYRLLRERLPNAAVVSVTHRERLARFHDRVWTLVPQEGGPARLEEMPAWPEEGRVP